VFAIPFLERLWTQPIFGASDCTVAHTERNSSWCFCAKRTARSWTEWEDLGDLFMAPFSKRVGASPLPGAGLKPEFTPLDARPCACDGRGLACRLRVQDPNANAG
jgi:hypothetical protein